VLTLIHRPDGCSAPTNIGRYLLIDAGQTPPVLLDARRLAGWTILPADGHCQGLNVHMRTDPRETHGGQETLF
jgi:hypothetical protein